MQRSERLAPPAGSWLRTFRTPPLGGPRVYFVHPGALPASVYAAQMAQALPSEAGIHVLDLSALAEYQDTLSPVDGGTASSIETIASCFRSRICELQAENPGPFVLAGWSFGGVIAFEMARLLRLVTDYRGLMLLDSIAPVPAYQKRNEDLDSAILMRWFVMYLAARREKPFTAGERELNGLGPEQQLELVLRRALDAGALSATTTIDGLRKLFRTFQAGLLRNNRLALAYRPKRLSSRTVLIKAERPLIKLDPTMGWRRLAGFHLRLARVSADHYTMLTDAQACAVIGKQAAALLRLGLWERLKAEFRGSPGEDNGLIILRLIS
jgi:thioesterase domain-containing protein